MNGISWNWPLHYIMIYNRQVNTRSDINVWMWNTTVRNWILIWGYQNDSQGREDEVNVRTDTTKLYIGPQAFRACRKRSHESFFNICWRGTSKWLLFSNMNTKNVMQVPKYFCVVNPLGKSSNPSEAFRRAALFCSVSLVSNLRGNRHRPRWSWIELSV